MTSEIKFTGVSAVAARPALTSAQVSSGRENSDKSGAGAVSVEKAAGRDEAGLRQVEFARALDTRDARYEEVLKVRTEDKQFVSAEEKLSAMKAGIESIVKRYPPYPSNSPERQALLNDVVGLRKQIEALTVPAENKGSAEEVKADIERKQYLRELMGLQEWPVDNISDEELAALLGQTEQAASAVAGAREAMWADVVDRVSPEDVAAAASLGQDSGEALALERRPISQDKQALADLA